MSVTYADLVKRFGLPLGGRIEERGAWALAQVLAAERDAPPVVVLSTAAEGDAWLASRGCVSVAPGRAGARSLCLRAAECDTRLACVVIDEFHRAIASGAIVLAGELAP